MRLTAIVILFLSYNNGVWGQAEKSAIDHYNKGVEYSNAKNYELAIASYSTCLEKDPNYIKAYYNRGTCAMSLQKYDDAIADFDKTINIDPEFTKAYLYMGYTRLLQGDYHSSIEILTKTIEKDPALSKAYLHRGTAHMNAINDMTQAITMGEHTYAAFLNRAICKNKIKDYAGALSDFTAAANLKPDQYVTAFEKAKIYLKLQKYHEAISELSYALRKNPSDADLYHYRGYAKLMMEDMASALTDYHICLQSCTSSGIKK